MSAVDDAKESSINHSLTVNADPSQVGIGIANVGKQKRKRICTMSLDAEAEQMVLRHTLRRRMFLEQIRFLKSKGGWL